MESDQHMQKASRTRDQDEATCHSDNQASDKVSSSDDGRKSTSPLEVNTPKSPSKPHPVLVPYAVNPYVELRRDIFFTLRDDYLRYAASPSELPIVTWEEYLNIVIQETHNLLETMEVAESDECGLSTKASSLNGVEVEPDTLAETEDEEEEACGAVPTIRGEPGVKVMGGGNSDLCSLAPAIQHEGPYSQLNIERAYSPEKSPSHSHG